MIHRDDIEAQNHGTGTSNYKGTVRIFRLLAIIAAGVLFLICITI